MRKALYIFVGVMCVTLSFAQRYTGYGRGIDLEGSSSFHSSDLIDYLFPIVIIILIIIGGVVTIIDKINSKISPTYNLKSFYKFRKQHGSFCRGCVVNSYTGDYFDICMFDREEHSYYYIGFSAYLEPLSYWDILNREKDLFLRWVGSRGYLLCSKESERLRHLDSKGSSKQIKEENTANMMYELNFLDKDGEHVIMKLP